MVLNIIPWILSFSKIVAASEILGNECHRKKSWVTRDVLDLCDDRRDLKKKAV